MQESDNFSHTISYHHAQNETSLPPYTPPTAYYTVDVPGRVDNPVFIVHDDVVALVDDALG